MNRNIVQEKSYAFAVRVVRMYQHLSDEKREFVLSKQVLRSGTSIGANVEEAIGGISKKDFAAKMSIAYKEARETSYWLRLLSDSGYIDDDAFTSIHGRCAEDGEPRPRRSSRLRRFQRIRSLVRCGPVD